MDEKSIEAVKLAANKLLEAVSAFVDQANTAVFDVGETSIALTAVGDLVEEIEDIMTTTNDEPDTVAA